MHLLPVTRYPVSLAPHPVSFNLNLIPYPVSLIPHPLLYSSPHSHCLLTFMVQLSVAPFDSHSLHLHLATLTLICHPFHLHQLQLQYWQLLLILIPCDLFYVHPCLTLFSLLQSLSCYYHIILLVSFSNEHGLMICSFLRSAGAIFPFHLSRVMFIPTLKVLTVYLVKLQFVSI